MMNSNMAADCIVINWLIMQHKSQNLIVFILFVCLRNFSENFASFTFVIFMKSFMIEPTHFVTGVENIVSLFALEDS